jgi:hypothetical protein
MLAKHAFDIRLIVNDENVSAHLVSPGRFRATRILAYAAIISMLLDHFIGPEEK